MDQRDNALYYFRNLIYCLYREIRVFEKRNYPKFFFKTLANSDYFDKYEGLIKADNLYTTTEQEQNVNRVIYAYFKETGFKLEEILEVFSQGDWERNGCISYGGPKWAEIAKVTLSLKNAIEQDDHKEMKTLIEAVNDLEHNHDKIVNKFKPRVY